jgi:uncharacterized protein (TIGR02594 family)
MEARAGVMRENGLDARISGFVRGTTQVLGEALKKAGDLLVEHFPEFAQPGGGTASPWLVIAKREHQFWETRSLVETAPEGAERVKTYFGATDHPVTATAPWCGAFVAYCLSECGNERAKASVIRGAALAANWKSWGDVELQKSVPGQLRPGAVVLLSPAADTGTSGHVGFLVGTTAGGDRILCLGGNQSNRVKISDYPVSRIVALRWLDVEDKIARGPDPGPAEERIGDPVSASEDELLIMARTLYAEARGEGRVGIEAVASVIINRVRSSRFPSTISGVCLQPFQFSCWNKNAPGRAQLLQLQPDADNDIRICMEVAKAAAAGNVVDQTGVALHYHSTSISRPSWVINSPDATSVTIGHHIFYNGIR